MQTRLKQAGIGFYLSGLLILTSGIALSIIATLGTSPFDALLVGLHRTFGLTVGSWEIVVGGTMVFCNAIAERKRPEYFALITSIITGIGIDFWLFVIRHIFIPETWVGYWLLLILSLLLCGLGIAIYLQSRIAPNPTDRSMLIVSKLTGFNLTYSRALVNGVLVIIAFQFNGAIGIGTLVIAILSGSFISIFFPFFQKLRESSSIKQKRKRLA
ncbi:YczE/YyaS/YitT family protein [Virgibacillus sp. W0181]|uniref:YczE/YyaS/YitT family protein n=1 Tax=Virgibacillus sp. W0181 TaxID=3391581 RepID=UPI003F473C46